MNVAPDRAHVGRWVVHVFGDSDEHIYHVETRTAVSAARRALYLYAVTQERATLDMSEARLESISAPRAPDYHLSAFLGAAPDYPEWIVHVMNVDD